MSNPDETYERVISCMDREYLTKLCDARDTLCGFCKANECEQCIVAHLVGDAYNELPEGDDGSYTAFVYEEDGVTAYDLATYDTKEDAINFAESCGWDEIVDDSSGEIVWRR